VSVFRGACLGCLLRGRPAQRPPPPRTHSCYGRADDERHSTAAQHRREVGVTASSAAAIAQISAAAGVVSYPGPTQEGYSLSDAKTKSVGKKIPAQRGKKPVSSRCPIRTLTHYWYSALLTSSLESSPSASCRSSEQSAPSSRTGKTGTT